ncbi:MAG: DNA-directed RNA polymerase subunit delta [Erysipelotrichaceae bacterium]|nr:DNA-directed RNA polymerase subunit delta [Erysipelotrichaceae bacterium]MCB9499947.1 DNA-directed RNA polymerase subunit delta [Erysipelotrichaceae bacterium]
MEENYKNESMVDVAYSSLVGFAKVVSFSELYDDVCAKLELTDEEKKNNISRFYTNLSLDGRFVTLGNNLWDLRKNQTYDKVRIDMNDVYNDIDNDTYGNYDKEEIDSNEEKEALGVEDSDDDDDEATDEETSDSDDKNL